MSAITNNLLSLQSNYGNSTAILRMHTMSRIRLQRLQTEWNLWTSCNTFYLTSHTLKIWLVTDEGLQYFANMHMYMHFYKGYQLILNERIIVVT